MCAVPHVYLVHVHLVRLNRFSLSESTDICRLVCETRAAVCVCLLTVLSERFLTGQLIMMAYLCMCNGMIY